MEREGWRPCHTIMASLSIAAAVLLMLAAYAQVQIPRFTAGHASAMLSRAVLAATGIALGSVSAAIYYPDASRALLVFLIGFGVVHFPAALILFFKDVRHSGRS